MKPILEKQFRQLAHALSQEILNAPTDQDVLAVFKQPQFASLPPQTLGDLFWRLDNQDTLPRLHSLRNHPTLGPQLFELFSEKT